MILGIGLAALVLVLGVASIAALNLLQDGGGWQEAANQGEPPSDTSDTPQRKEPEATTAERPAGEDDVEKRVEAIQDAVEKEEASLQEESGPAPGYNLIRDPTDGLTVEVPPSWGVETGENSEKEAGPNTWSYHAGTYITSSITTAPNLDAWYSTGTSGTYLVASKSLAQEYTDYELTHSLMFANKAQNCASGPSKNYDRPPYSGTMQAWFECGPDGADTYTIAAAPEGRECVVVLDARISDEADREAVEHLIDTFEVDCSKVS